MFFSAVPASRSFPHSKFDLYSKSDKVPDPKALKPYYQSLIDKYCPGELEW